MKTVACTCSMDENNIYLHPRYIRYLTDTAAKLGYEIMPVMLPVTDDVSVIDRYAEVFDGYLFTGGLDVEPWRYGEERLPCCGNSTPARDAFELALLERLIARDCPVFGICRGIQIMNVALGGTLWQDFTSQLNQPEDAPHSVRDETDTPRHPVRLSGSLRDLLGTDEILTNSFHHQAVRNPGRGLEIVGVSRDEVIEAVAHQSLSFYRAVQWHPEIRPDAISERLLAAFFRSL